MEASDAVTGVDHVTIAVPDLGMAVAQYTAILGWPPSWRGEHPDLGTSAALFGCWNGMVELVAPKPGDFRAEALRGHLRDHGPGLAALALRTSDAATCRTALKARGVSVTPPESGLAVGDAGAERRYRALTINPRQTRGLPVHVVERDDLATLLAQQPPGADEMSAIDHVVIHTTAPDDAIAFYGTGLGIRLALDRDLAGTRMLFFRTGGVTLEVVGAPEPEPTAGQSEAGRDTFYGIAYRTLDIDACHGRLASAGFTVDAVRDGNKRGTRVFTIRDGTSGVPTLVLSDPSRPAHGRHGS